MNAPVRPHPDPAADAGTLADPAAGPADQTGPTLEEIRARLDAWLADTVLTPEADLSAPLLDLGVDSLDLIRTARRVEAAFGVRVQLRELAVPEMTTALTGRAGRRASRPPPYRRRRTARRRPRPGRAHPSPGAGLGGADRRPGPLEPGDALHHPAGPPWRAVRRGRPPPGRRARLAALGRRGPPGPAAPAAGGGHRPRRPARRGPRPGAGHGGHLRTRRRRTAGHGHPALRDRTARPRPADRTRGPVRPLRLGPDPPGATADPHPSARVRHGLLVRPPGRPGQLAFDMVSWSVLLEDLEELYTALEAGRRDVWCAEGTPYPEWARALAAHARTPEAEAEAEWWTDVVRTPATIPLDHAVADPRAANTARTAATYREEFPQELTTRLHTAARAHRAHPGDLVLHALGEALAGWLDETAVRVDILRHGREEAVGDSHLARTTGWFTTIVPVRLDLAPGTAAERLARTVGHLAAQPGGGVGYGALSRHGRPRISAALRAAPPSDISFDFEGDDADALPLRTLLPDMAPEPVGDITAPHWTRPHLIEVIATTDDEVLRVEWWYSTALHDEATVRDLAARHRAALTALLDAAAPDAAGTRSS
nr:StnR [Streptomyces sp. TP-A0356]